MRKCFKQVTAVLTALFFALQGLGIPSVFAQQPISIQGFTIPAAGTPLALSEGFAPVVLRGVKVDLKDPFRFNFIVDSGQDKVEGEKFKVESQKLIKYFLASLTTPEDDLWVNLSPYEKDRIIPNEFGTTEMGRDLLTQDYLLKQLSASLIDPDTELGKEYWKEVEIRTTKYESRMTSDERRKTNDPRSTFDVSRSSFSKIWIVPDRAVVYQSAGSAFIGQTRLKVMLEEDYKAWNVERGTSNIQRPTSNVIARDSHEAISTDVFRQIVLPHIEKEVNEGKNFAPLRQVYHSLILAAWYKRTLKQSILSQVFVDKNKVAGVDVKDKDVKQKIYEQYLMAFKKGAFDLIREEEDANGELVPRKYFAGGILGKAVSSASVYKPLAGNETEAASAGKGPLTVVEINAEGVKDAGVPVISSFDLDQLHAQEWISKALTAKIERDFNKGQALAFVNFEASGKENDESRFTDMLKGFTDDQYVAIMVKGRAGGEFETFHVAVDRKGNFVKHNNLKDILNIYEHTIKPDQFLFAEAYKVFSEARVVYSTFIAIRKNAGLQGYGYLEALSASGKNLKRYFPGYYLMDIPIDKAVKFWAERNFEEPGFSPYSREYFDIISRTIDHLPIEAGRGFQYTIRKIPAAGSGVVSSAQSGERKAESGEDLDAGRLTLDAQKAGSGVYGETTTQLARGIIDFLNARGFKKDIDRLNNEAGLLVPRELPALFQYMSTRSGRQTRKEDVRAFAYAYEASGGSRAEVRAAQRIIDKDLGSIFERILNIADSADEEPDVKDLVTRIARYSAIDRHDRDSLVPRAIPPNPPALAQGLYWDLAAGVAFAQTVKQLPKDVPYVAVDNSLFVSEYLKEYVRLTGHNNITILREDVMRLKQPDAPLATIRVKNVSAYVKDFTPEYLSGMLNWLSAGGQLVMQIDSYVGTRQDFYNKWGRFIERYIEDGWGLKFEQEETQSPNDRVAVQQLYYDTLILTKPAEGQRYNDRAKWEEAKRQLTASAAVVPAGSGVEQGSSLASRGSQLDRAGEISPMADSPQAGSAVVDDIMLTANGESLPARLQSVSAQNPLTANEVSLLPGTGNNIKNVIAAAMAPGSIAYSVRFKEDNRLAGYIVAVPEDQSIDGGDPQNLYVLATAVNRAFAGAFLPMIGQLRDEAQKRGFKNISARVDREGIASGVHRILRTGGRVKRLIADKDAYGHLTLVRKLGWQDADADAAETAQKQMDFQLDLLNRKYSTDRTTWFEQINGLLTRYPNSVVAIEIPIGVPERAGSGVVSFKANNLTVTDEMRNMQDRQWRLTGYPKDKSNISRWAESLIDPPDRYETDVTPRDEALRVSTIKKHLGVLTEELLSNVDRDIKDPRDQEEVRLGIAVVRTANNKKVFRLMIDQPYIDPKNWSAISQLAGFELDDLSNIPLRKSLGLAQNQGAAFQEYAELVVLKHAVALEYTKGEDNSMTTTLWVEVDRVPDADDPGPLLATAGSGVEQGSASASRGSQLDRAGEISPMADSPQAGSAVEFAPEWDESGNFFESSKAQLSDGLGNIKDLPASSSSIDEEGLKKIHASLAAITPDDEKRILEVLRVVFDFLGNDAAKRKMAEILDLTGNRRGRMQFLRTKNDDALRQFMEVFQESGMIDVKMGDFHGATMPEPSADGSFFYHIVINNKLLDVKDDPAAALDLVSMLYHELIGHTLIDELFGTLPTTEEKEIRAYTANIQALRSMQSNIAAMERKYAREKPNGEEANRFLLSALDPALIAQKIQKLEQILASYQVSLAAKRNPPDRPGEASPISKKAGSGVVPMMIREVLGVPDQVDVFREARWFEPYQRFDPPALKNIIEDSAKKSDNLQRIFPLNEESLSVLDEAFQLLLADDAKEIVITILGPGSGSLDDQGRTITEMRQSLDRIVEVFKGQEEGRTVTFRIYDYRMALLDQGEWIARGIVEQYSNVYPVWKGKIQTEFYYGNVNKKDLWQHMVHPTHILFMRHTWVAYRFGTGELELKDIQAFMNLWLTRIKDGAVFIEEGFLKKDAPLVSFTKISLVRNGQLVAGSSGNLDDNQSIASTVQEVGGIDFNPNKLDMDLRGEAGSFAFPADPAQIQNFQFDGLIPVIINITPIPSLPAFWGLSAESGERGAESG